MLDAIRDDLPGETLISSATVRARYGGDRPISDMSLWRWLKDPDLNFPKPIVIQRRRFWRLAELRAWERQREARRDGAAA
jgi:predicted DNA-binding transcriptional regulator AlpA